MTAARAVTGASGFVGRHLVAQWRRAGHPVLAIARGGRPLDVADDPGCAWVAADVRDTAALLHALRESPPAALVHCAGYPWPGRSVRAPLQALDSVVLGTAALLEALREAAPACRCVLVGTAEEYGTVPAERQPIPEDAPLAPPTPYALAKRAATELGLQYHRNHGLPVIGVRAFNHTGPGQRAGFVCPEFAEQVIVAERAGGGAIRVGAADVVRDFADVRDVAAAYEALCARGEPGRVYNVCSGVGRTIGDVARTLAGLGRVPVTVAADPERARPRAWDTPRLVGDPSRLHATTGWRATTPFERTLSDLLESVRGARG